jgi:hypothetical protein
VKNFCPLFFLFLYIYPIFIGALPIPNDRILQVIGLAFIICTPFFRSQIFKNVNYYKFVLFSIITIFLAFLPQIVKFRLVDVYFIKDSLGVFFLLLSSYFIVFIFNKKDENFNITKLFEGLIIVFFLQAIISFIFFFSQGLFESYISFLKVETNQGLLDRTGLLNKRLIGVGSAFFSGVIKYGFALLILTCLPYLKDSWIYKNKFFYVLCYLVILIAGIMTGRFFFVAIFVSVMLFILLQSNNPFKGLFKLIKISLLSIPLFALIYQVAKMFVEGDRLDIILNFVFEIFINFIENGEVGTSSSDATISMYIFPKDLISWLFGDGKMLMSDGSYYMGSDVGYIRLIFYFGLISTILYFFIQFLYYKLLMNLTKDKHLKILFFMMFVWVALLNFKGIANGNEYVTLFLICLIYDKKKHHLNEK